ncbi:CBO0543 family protein [Paenibacillus tarimensis]|uniref:CBO0543 family protein n=1 Tax=Paenibacillus tarimensis TaxID=416012 RepID=UPI0038B39843
MAFLIASIIVFNTIAFLIPKRMTRAEIYSTLLFASVFQLITDYYLVEKYQLYGYFVKGPEFKELLVFFGIFPAANTIYLNFFPVSGRKTSKIIYILAWSAFITLFEWASVKAGYFYYSGWKLGYSALLYPLILCVLAANFAFLRKLKRHG